MAAVCEDKLEVYKIPPHAEVFRMLRDTKIKVQATRW